MTRQELINRVKIKIDELTPVDGLFVPIGLSEDKPIDSFIEGLLDESCREVLLTAPVDRLDATSMACVPVKRDSGTGYVVLPDDFTRLVSFKMKEWRIPVWEFATGSLARRQYNRFTRGGTCKPACVLSHVKDKAVIDYFSVKNVHDVEFFLYVKCVPAESVRDDLQEVVAWMCASRVLQVVGRLEESRAAHERGLLVPVRAGRVVYQDQPEPERKAKISIGYHPADGSFGMTEPRAEAEVSIGSDFTVRMNPADGCEVEKFNVDTVALSAANQYTFKNVLTDHTMYVWFKRGTPPPVIDTDFLERNDKPGTYYSSVHTALNSVKADYPVGLTGDVTITCVKQAIDRRNPNDPDKVSEKIFLSVLKDFNQDSLYTLTLDGKDLLTLNCVSLGGLKFDNVDNIVIKNTKFINYANYIEGGTPDEVAAILAQGNKDKFFRNMYIQDCSFNGLSPVNNSSCSTYTLSIKQSENIYICNSVFLNSAGMTFRMLDCKMCAFVKNNISGKFRSGAVSHAGHFEISNGSYVTFEDNDINCDTFYESAAYISGIDNIYFKRNHVHGGARFVEISSGLTIKNIVIEGNLLENMVKKGIFGWIHEIFLVVSDVGNFEFNSNTAWMSGDDYIQFLMRMGTNHVNSFKFFNNIIVDPDPSLTASKLGFFIVKSMTNLSMGYNLFKVSVKNEETGQTYGVIVDVLNPDGRPDSITISGGNTRLLKYFTDNSYDTGSVIITKPNKLLDIETGGTTYAITSGYDSTFPAGGDVPRFDHEYREKATVNSRGCYNIRGTIVDEANDTTVGYSGRNLTMEGNFTNETQYQTLSDCMLLLQHNTRNRDKFIKFLVEGTQNASIALGKYSVIHTTSELDENGEYKADELYTIKVN